MFICNPCIKERFANNARFAQSMGLCEFCNNMRSCSDIPAGQLVDNPDYVDPEAESSMKVSGRVVMLKDGRVFKKAITKDGIVGFAQGVALVNGLPVLRDFLAGKHVKVTIEVFDD